MSSDAPFNEERRKKPSSPAAEHSWAQLPPPAPFANYRDIVTNYQAQQVKWCNLLQTRWRTDEKSGAGRRGECGGALGAGSLGAAHGASSWHGKGSCWQHCCVCISECLLFFSSCLMFTSSIALWGLIKRIKWWGGLAELGGINQAVIRKEINLKS